MSQDIRPEAPPQRWDPSAMSDEEFDTAYGAAYPPLRYHQLLRTGRSVWWGLLGIVLLGLAMLIVLPLVWLLPFVLYLVLSGQDLGAWFTGLSTLGDPTPSMLAYLMLTLASLIPVTWLLVRVVHGVKPRWLTSVAPRMRWGYFAACTGAAVVALVATLVVSAVISAIAPAGAMAGETGGAVNAFTSSTLGFLLVVILIVPFQAAGEEYVFRGYLTQVLGGITNQVWVAVLVPALLFAIAHGSQSAPVFLDRFAFGVVAGLLVVWTGGLEAAIAGHILNNWFAFGLALAFGDIGSSLSPSGGSWWMIPVTLTQSLVYLGLALAIARRMGLSRRASGRALVAPEHRV